MHAIELPDELVERSLRLAQALGLAFAGIDLKLTPNKQLPIRPINFPFPEFQAARRVKHLTLAVAGYPLGTDLPQRKHHNPWKNKE